MRYPQVTQARAYGWLAVTQTFLSVICAGEISSSGILPDPFSSRRQECLRHFTSPRDSLCLLVPLRRLISVPGPLHFTPYELPNRQ